MNPHGRSALVTGAGRSIGEACARALSASGHHVWVNDIDEAEVIRVAGDVRGSAAVGDVTTPSEWIGPVLKGGPLHVLVHSAGYDLETPLADGDVDAFDRMLRLQMSAPFELTSRLLPLLTKARGAAVIFISSVQGGQTYPRMAAYAGAKAGQLGMVKSLALELGAAKIRVLAVAPGYIDSRLMEAWIQSTKNPTETRAHADALHPLGRIGTPADVGALVAFLASPAAAFINGTNIVIDGGLSARYP